MKKISNNSKIIYVIIFTCLSLLYFCSCEKKEPPVSPIPDELLQRVISELNLENDFAGVDYKSDSEAQKLSESKAKELYMGEDKNKQAVDLSRIEKYSIKLGSDISANETGIFRVYDKSSSVEYVEDIVKNRLLSVQQKFKDFMGEDDDAHRQLNTANSGEVRTYGEYIYYVIHPDKDKIFEKIENIFRDE
jgi:hypothetical protein